MSNLFLVFFNKYGEDNEIISEIKLPITSNFTHNLTQSDRDDISIQWTLENRIRSIQMKESVWNFQKITSMKISFFKSAELDGSSYAKNTIKIFRFNKY